jgi:phage tail sheath protein FI
MPTYKTPDVYVEEISLLPRSVAEVETAIPVFIGYTEKANDGQRDLGLIPTAVDSLLEFEDVFGGEPDVKIVANSLVLDASGNVQSVEFATNYQLFDSIRLFYANGGGRCYIVSVGNYNAAVTSADLKAGIDAVRKQDEPTLFVIPDAVQLGAGLYDVQKAALNQCAELKDRFAILDLREDLGWQAGVDDFRNQIGINNLSYGAAYTPQIRTTLPLLVTFRELDGHIPTIRNTADPQLLATFDRIEHAIADRNEVRKHGAETLNEDYDKKLSDFRTALNAKQFAAAQAAFKELFDFIYTKNVTLVDTWARNPAGLLKTAEVPAAAKNAITGVLLSVFRTLNSYDREIETFTGVAGLNNLFTTADRIATAPEWTNVFAPGPAADNTIYPIAAPATDDDRLANMRAAEPRITALFRQFASATATVLASAKQLEETVEDTLREQNPLYASVSRAVGSFRRTVPPSGAIAGIYAAVDSTRGVWKAPANVSLNEVSDVTQVIDNKEQAGLNVDPTAGKSINAIRPFTGRGILVWGARTLAGNDNEWRYVSVRRFFIMVEESLRKSTLFAVFENNDANLWIKIKSMIENYLIDKWRDGALAGAKPEEAFFVNVGLGSTMTAKDILAGLLIVEVGIAVVRPAEFIILRFSHKLQTS